MGTSDTRRLPMIYIAGPFRGATPLDVRRNIERARDVGIAVATAGGYPMIPHTMTGDFDKQLTDDFWLQGALQMLTLCDGMVLTSDWERSTGARAEFKQAVDRRLPYMVYNDAHGLGAVHMRLERWIAGIIDGKPAGSLIPGV